MLPFSEKPAHVAHGLLRSSCLFLLTLLFSSSIWAQSTTVVISQVYGGGGSTNTSVTYNADYVELFNLSASPIKLDGFAIQYGSATGTSSTSAVATIPSGTTLQPGQYYLIAAAADNSTYKGANLPVTPDLTSKSSVFALSGTAGKVFLTNTATALTLNSSGCPTSSASVVDFVGYGTTANCFEGTKYAPAASLTTSDVRLTPCTDTNQNGTDFTTDTTPVPHNTASTLAPCGGTAPPTSISLTAPTANPGSVYQNSPTLLTVKVTPGTSPASTGITVTADLSAFGDSSAQALNDSGTNGDVTAGDGIYSYSLTVPASAPLGASTIAISASDSQLRKATASIPVTVLAQVALVPIHTIQGNTPGTAAYNGQNVTTTGIVTGVTANGFYLQTKDSDADSDPSTPEGIYVYTGSGKVPATATVGTDLQVSGTVALYPATGSMTPGTELDSPSGFTVLSTNQPLPAAITLTTTNPSPSGGIYQLIRYQSMRVAVPSFTATEGTQGTLDEPDETYTSNGQFWGTVTGVPRPVREPGLEVLDPLTPTEPSTIARFDDNPEVFAVDSLAMQGGSAGPIDLASNAVLTNMLGVMDFSGGSPLFIIDATTRPVVTGGMTATAAKAAKAGEVTIADQNMERFYNSTKDTSGAVVVTSAAYTLRLAKGSLVIRNMLGMPDIVCLEEMENLSTLTDLSNKISSDAVAAGQTDPLYAPYLVLGNDSSGISVGFLVKPSKINVLNVTQFGLTTMFTQPGTGQQAILNDRPPLVLHAGIKRPNAADYPLTVIVNHLRSLNGVTDNTSSGQNVRAKREQQAEYLANLIQGYQTAGEHVISVGDYNAFEFNDGIVDSLGIIKGNPAPANQDIVAGQSGLVSPNLVDMAPTDISTNTYSYVYLGNAQSIDHVLVTPELASITSTSPAHFDADFPVVYRNDATRPEASSDHDGVVAYIQVPGATVLSFSSSSLTFTPQVLGTTVTQTVTVQNSGTSAITLSKVAASSNFGETNDCGSSLAASKSCTVTVSFTPTTTGAITGTLTLTDSDVTGTQTVALNGTGVATSSSVTLSAPPTTVIGSNVTLTATVSGNAGTTPTGSVTFTDGSTMLKTVPLTSGAASYSTSTLAVGTHSITASYSGDSTYPASGSSPSSVIVNPAPAPDFTFSVANSSILVSQSLHSGSTVLSVAMVNGFNQSVTFACSGLPANSHCTFAPATLTASGNSTLTVTIGSSSAALHQDRTPWNQGGRTMLALMLLGVPFTLRRRVRGRVRTVLGMLMLGVMLAAVSGCGGSANTAAGTSTVTVTATGGSVSHTSTFTLNVQ